MDTVKRLLVKRVAVVGPECTGKTALSKALAGYYQTVWVPEFARSFIDQLNRPYIRADLLAIAQGQLQSENELALTANRVLICDTNLIVIKVWSEFKYGHCDDAILKLMSTQHYDHYFLTDIDVPWEDDPQREHPDKREYFFTVYRKELEMLNVSFTLLSGNLQQRLHTATTVINSLLSDKD
ncbi:MAG: AAA family ATPase [Cyclobacteriaceae bacterium]